MLFPVLDKGYTLTMKAEKKGDLLQKEFKIPKTTIMDKEIKEMGALSAAIRQEGEKKGRKEGRKEGKRIARKEDAARVAQKLLVEGYTRDEVASIVRDIWRELTEEDVLAAVSSAPGA